MMGTYISVSLPKDKLSLSSLAFKRLKKVELALSSYDKNAEIYKLNHERKTLISKDTYEAFSLCKKYYKQSNGFFDISIGSITKGLFHFGQKERVPSEAEFLNARIDFKGLHFNTKEAWIKEGVKIDLGGMGKGFGVDKAVEVLKAKGAQKAVVALSGDIFCFHKCKMSIQDPFSDGLLASFKMAQPNTSISTSGNYRRFVKNKNYNHLINPKTKHSQTIFASITLISRKYSNADLDAYATAASVMPKIQAFSFLKKMHNLGYIVITRDKQIYINEYFKGLTQDFKMKRSLKSGEREYIKAVPLIFQNSKKKAL
ncbi:FAD:protein FMN transferase [Sulfurimonas sp. MAG313]|nr:FAD:protein FMN transferase [Sulfurimonas sp. MAG313]MDF1880400.1 FAD:protein FMN transferase [Sulfurimonas sp. MAG313]